MKKILRVWNWDEIREVIGTKVVTGSLIWLFILPPIASLAASLESLLDGEYRILPLTWIMLYCAAVVFALAKVIYWMNCPKIVKLTGSYADFLNRGFFDKEIKEWFVELASIDGTKKNLRAGDLLGFIGSAKGSGNITKAQLAELFDGDAGVQIKSDFWNVAIPQENIPDIYFYTRKHSLNQKKNCRKTLTYLAILGFAIFGVVFLLNFGNVICYYVF